MGDGNRENQGSSHGVRETPWSHVALCGALTSQHLTTFVLDQHLRACDYSVPAMCCKWDCASTCLLCGMWLMHCLVARVHHCPRRPNPITKTK